jgi:hypothetical protein
MNEKRARLFPYGEKRAFIVPSKTYFIAFPKVYTPLASKSGSGRVSGNNGNEYKLDTENGNAIKLLKIKPRNERIRVTVQILYMAQPGI